MNNPTLWLDARARLLPLSVHTDARGRLGPLDFTCLPFVPQRLFTVTDVPPGGVRGQHGHRSSSQLLVCLQGDIGIEMRCGDARATTVLHPGGPGLLLEAGVWSSQTYRDRQTVLLVLASEPYDTASYIDAWGQPL